NFFGVNLVPGGISYVGGNMSGWQSTLVGLNIVGKTVWGLQATFGGYNSAQILDKSSWQIALVGINNVEENRGIQAGAIPPFVINSAQNSEEGIQYGMINYSSQKAKLQVGILNIALDNSIPVLPFVNF
ncbi:MAG TPA: hypothetical protein PKV80_15850, partial [Leptospiraceae bacterium]|nr:hypothetical protein [Leptospiraceae bacterium]